MPRHLQWAQAACDRDGCYTADTKPRSNSPQRTSVLSHGLAEPMYRLYLQPTLF